MKTNEKKNTSAKKKLIPAVAMLTTSAVMLSTATYAWFTMNKDAEVTGLEMTATAGGGLEIPLGNIGNGELGTISTPTMDDISWKSVVNVGEYYDKISKIKPASTVDGNNIYYADDGNITAGGKVVQDSAKVVKAAYATDKVAMTVRNNYTSDGELSVNTGAGPTAGRFVDIPMWVRTTNKQETKINCEVTINDGKTNADDGTELQNAVRVSVIPLKNENVKSTGGSVTALGITGADNYTTGGAHIYGLTFDSYRGASAEAPKGIKATKAADAKYDSDDVLGIVTANKTKINTGDNTDAANVFTLAAASTDSYSVESFVVRVWLEGESIYCNDANAAQDWNIQLNFTTDDTTGN